MGNHSFDRLRAGMSSDVAGVSLPESSNNQMLNYNLERICYFSPVSGDLSFKSLLLGNLEFCYQGGIFVDKRSMGVISNIEQLVKSFDEFWNLKVVASDSTFFFFPIQRAELFVSFSGVGLEPVDKFGVWLSSCVALEDGKTLSLSEIHQKFKDSMHSVFATELCDDPKPKELGELGDKMIFGFTFLTFPPVRSERYGADVIDEMFKNSMINFSQTFNAVSNQNPGLESATTKSLIPISAATTSATTSSSVSASRPR